jgi:transcriptional regulator with XRE-family HTH domain
MVKNAVAAVALGQRIRQARLRTPTRMTQEEVAAALRITRGNVAQFENGSRVPDVFKLRLIAHVLGTTLSELIGDELMYPTTQRTPIQASASGELGCVLSRAVAIGEPIFVDTGEALYELEVQTVARSDFVDGDVEPDALLGIIGMVSSAEPTNIARDKDAYLAEAFDPRSQR